MKWYYFFATTTKTSTHVHLGRKTHNKRNKHVHYPYYINTAYYVNQLQHLLCTICSLSFAPSTWHVQWNVCLSLSNIYTMSSIRQLCGTIQMWDLRNLAIICELIFHHELTQNTRFHCMALNKLKWNSNCTAEFCRNVILQSCMKQQFSIRKPKYWLTMFWAVPCLLFTHRPRNINSARHFDLLIISNYYLIT
jgi:hypothetical protein